MSSSGRWSPSASNPLTTVTSFPRLRFSTRTRAACFSGGVRGATAGGQVHSDSSCPHRSHRGGRSNEPDLLRSCYRRCLELAAGAGLRSVAFPCVSTGVYGYPKADACRITVGTAVEWLSANKLPATVTFCCFGEDDVRVYEAVLGNNH